MTATDFFAALAGTQFEIVATPGAGKFVQPTGPLVISYIPGVNPLVSFGTSTFNVNTGDFTAFINANTIDVFTGGASQFWIPLNALPFNFADLTNQPLALFFGVVNGRILTSHLVSGGADWQVGDTFYLATGTGAHASFLVDTVDGMGAVLTYHLVSGGTVYHVGTGYTGYPTNNVNNSSGVRAAVINAPGTGYAPGDTGNIDTGSGDASFNVDTVDGMGGVTGLTLTYPGTGYTAGAGVTTTATSGIGVGLTVDITILGSGVSIQVDTIDAINPDFDGSFVITVPYAIVTIP
jgi:hypothetical protein